MDNSSYHTVKAPAGGEFVEKRSRFLGEIRPVRSEEEAAAFIAEKKSRHWDASHNCYAYILRENGVQRYSDDGEPQGTAGVPILEVLRKEAIFDAAIVVTRYFGGTLLGAGGLVRAYTKSAKIALDAATLVTIRKCAVFSLEVPYPLYDRVNLLLSETESEVISTDFLASVTIQARIPQEGLAHLSSKLTELSGGQIAPINPVEEMAPMESFFGEY